MGFTLTGAHLKMMRQALERDGEKAMDADGTVWIKRLTPATALIDLNVRVRGGTFVGFEDITDGPVAPGQRIVVCEPESGLRGEGMVGAVDWEADLVYIDLDWEGLR